MANKSQIIGPNVDQTWPGTTTDGANAPVALGTVVNGDGITYMLVQAGEAISTTTSEPFALAIDENFQAKKVTTALATERHRLGIAPRLVIADNDFFYARIGGANIPLRVAASAAANTTLKTTTTAGRLGTASTVSAVAFAGAVIVLVASASTSAGNSIRNALLVNPVPVSKGVVLNM
jgi:hypothetical protein